MTSTPDSIEDTIIVVVRWVKRGVEIFGAGLVTLGVCVTIVHLTREVKWAVAYTSGESHYECACD
jgi:hypothetical protein